MPGWLGLDRYSYGNHPFHTVCVQAVLLVMWKPVTGWRKERKTYLARTNPGPVRKEPMCSPYDQVALMLCALK